MADQQLAARTPAVSAFTKFLLVLAIVGALNWGLIGFFNFNVVDAIFGGGVHEETSSGSRVVYALVGLAGLLAIFLFPWSARRIGHPTSSPLRA